jgi:Cupin domain
MEKGWRAVSLDDVEAVRWQGTELIWRPLRRALGTHIVGMAAYTAERAGQEVVEGHDEDGDGRGHEEVYIVLSGRARFTLGGEELDAPPGTFVLVRPGTYRRAVAAEPDTVVLALGGPATFEPSASEWIERARAYARTQPERALEIVDELRAQRPDSPGVPIAEALLALAQNDRKAAQETLAALLMSEPALKAPLAADPDLGPLVAGPDQGS